MVITKIRCFEDILSISDRSAPIVTLFSGGLDSSYLLSFLFEAGFTSVCALCVDLGDTIEIEQLQNTAQRFKAELIVVDAKDEFANIYVKPALMAHAKYLDIFPISSSLARPLYCTTGGQICIGA